jgi:HSP90 family molecular chaperone
MADFARKQKVLEINPRSPLIEGLLRRIEQLPSEEEERDLEAEDELREVTSILIDGALVRSGFEVTDSNEWVSCFVKCINLSSRILSQILLSHGSRSSPLARRFGDRPYR